jgi:hypothetical protein
MPISKKIRQKLCRQIGRCQVGKVLVVFASECDQVELLCSKAARFHAGWKTA